VKRLPNASAARLQERVDPEALRPLVEALRSNTLLDVLLGWLDGFVVVLDRRRQIVAASDGLAAALGAEGEDLIGRRLGEVLGCAYAGRGPAGCGTSASCRHCGALRAILCSQQQDEPLEGACTIQRETPSGRVRLALELRAARAEADGERLTVLAFRRRDGAAFDDDGWPVDLERYLQVRLLGVGAMGSVFLVEDGEGGRYALKVLRPRVREDAHLAARFAREAEVSRRLDHPHVVRTLDAGEVDGCRYLVFEHCALGSAADLLQERGPLTSRQGVRWLWQAVRGLDYVWREHGVVHRDLKPDNLLVDAEGRLKLADFGVAADRRAAEPGLTATRVVVGTPFYLSPEQAVAEPDLDVQSDVFSLGASFYHLLAGERPFEGTSIQGLLLARGRERPRPLADAAPHVWPELAALVDAMLANAPAARPVPEAIAARLERLAAAEGVDLEGPAPIEALGARWSPTDATVAVAAPTALA